MKNNNILKLKNMVVLLFLGLAMISFTGCTGDDSSENSVSEDWSNKLFMVSGETGSLEPGANENEYIVTLNNVARNVRWITDRPARKSGVETTDKFIGNVWPEIFEQTAPNAVLKFLIASQNGGLFLTLKKPEYDETRRSLEFTATLIRSTFEDDNSTLETRLDFDNPAIVILNNGDGFNYVVHSEEAMFEVSGYETEFSITQDKLDNEVLWAGGAPLTLSNVTNVDVFAECWDAMFSAVPPNAFIFGIDNTGALKSYSVTLNNMTYSSENDQLTYTASILEDESVENIILDSVTFVIDMDFLGMLMQDNFYGLSIARDVRMAFSFNGIPSTEKNHQIKDVIEDVVCAGVNIPLQQDQNMAPAIGNMRFQSVDVYDPSLRDTKDWMNLRGQGYTASKKGKLSIGVYSKLGGSKYLQIASFECDNACAVQYINGNISFLCTGTIIWAARCKTQTNDPTKQDWFAAWNNL